MTTEIPTTPPTDESYYRIYDIGRELANPVADEDQPLGLTSDGAPITRVASDNEFARIIDKHQLSLEDVAGDGLDHKNAPNPLRHPLAAKAAYKHNWHANDYAIESQTRENLSPNKAHEMAIAEDPFHVRASEIAKQDHSQEGLVAGLVVGALAVASARGGAPINSRQSLYPGWGVTREEQAAAMGNAQWKEQVSAGNAAAQEAGLAFDRQQAQEFLAQLQGQDPTEK